MFHMNCNFVYVFCIYLPYYGEDTDGDEAVMEDLRWNEHANEPMQKCIYQPDGESYTGIDFCLPSV